MKRLLVPVIFALAATLGIAFAQSSAYTPTGIGLQFNPNFYSGMVPTPNQWNIWFSNKIDANPAGCPISLGCTGANNAPQALINLGAFSSAGGTMTGKLTTLASSTSGAGLNLPHGAAPTAPVNGDIWTTTTGLFARINGTTATYLNVGAPLGAKLTFIAPTTSTASANYPHGTAPTSPDNGDMWTTTAGFYTRINGVTVGPYIGLGVPLTQIMTFVAPSSGTASINLPHGTAPSAPSNGDAWTTTGGLFMRINGVTWGPFFAGGATLTSPVLTAASGTGAAGLNIPHGTAPSSPNNGDVWTTTSGLFARINGATVGPYFSTAGGTFTGKVTTVASASGNAGFNLPHGSAPSSPTNGDLWTTTSGLLARINGSTVGPFVTESTGWSNVNANQFYGGPSSGSAAAPSFRALVAADIPYGSDILLFGDGSDGANNCTGSQTLTKDMHYSSLTIGASCALNTAGYRVYVQGTLTFSGGTIGWNAANDAAAGAAGGSGGTGGAGGTATATAYLGGAIAGTTGQTGSISEPAQAASPATGGHNGGSSGNGGKGGGGSAGNPCSGTCLGGNGQTAVYQPIAPSVPVGLYLSTATGFSQILGGSSGAGGGGGAGNGSTDRGGGGGGGGPGAGTVFIAALTIDRTSLTAQDIVAKGGNGGAGGNGAAGVSGGGGGGSGGGGGDIIVMFRNITGNSVSNAFDVSGGNGGAGGNGAGTGGGGTGGRAGFGGRVMIYNLGAGTLTTTAPTTPPTAGAPSGTTGGGSTSNASLVNF